MNKIWSDYKPNCIECGEEVDFDADYRIYPEGYICRKCLGTGYVWADNQEIAD